MTGPRDPATTPETLEAEAGRLLLQSARLRRDRLGPGDAHELRHLLACVEAGNSDGCDGGADCTLDRAAIRGREGLDVERLAEALFNVAGSLNLDVDDFDHNAEVLAAEYDRLAAEPRS